MLAGFTGTALQDVSLAMLNTEFVGSDLNMKG